VRIRADAALEAEASRINTDAVALAAIVETERASATRIKLEQQHFEEQEHTNNNETFEMDTSLYALQPHSNYSAAIHHNNTNNTNNNTSHTTINDNDNEKHVFTSPFHGDSSCDNSPLEKRGLAFGNMLDQEEMDSGV
jgi:hypothetical protein